MTLNNMLNHLILRFLRIGLLFLLITLACLKSERPSPSMGSYSEILGYCCPYLYSLLSYGERHKSLQSAQLTAGVTRPHLLPVSVHCGWAPSLIETASFSPSIPPFSDAPLPSLLLRASIAPNLRLTPNQPVLCSEDVMHALGCFALPYSCTYFFLCSVHTEGWLSFSFTLALLLLCSPYSLSVN